MTETIEVVRFKKEGLTDEQKKWLNARDQKLCRFSVRGRECENGCWNNHKTSLHHITPQSNFKKNELDYGSAHPFKNSPFNIITVCDIHNKIVHPRITIYEALYRRAQTRGDVEAMEQLKEKMDINHNDIFDDELFRNAEFRTICFLKETGIMYPSGAGYDGQYFEDYLF